MVHGTPAISETDAGGNIATGEYVVSVDNLLIIAAGVVGSTWASVAPCCSLAELFEGNSGNGDDIGYTAAFGVQTTGTTISASSFVITTEGNTVKPEGSVVYGLLEDAAAMACDTIRMDFDCTELTSVDPDSFLDDDAYFDPDVAAGDSVEYEELTTNEICSVTIAADGLLSLTKDGGCPANFQTFDYCPLDASNSFAEFTNPVCDDTVFINNADPIANEEAILVYESGEAITAVVLSDYCSDADGHTITYTVETAFPTGLSLSMGEIVGTPTTSNYPTGAAAAITCTDPAGASAQQDFFVYVYDAAELVVPDLVGSDTNEAIALELAAFPWRTEATLDTSETAYSDTVAAELIISQIPAASTEVAFDQELSAVVSLGEQPEGGAGARRNIGIGIRIGL
jgi:hypothetical protein